MRERLLASTVIVGAFAAATTGQAFAQAIQSAPVSGAQPVGPTGGNDSVPTPATSADGASTQVKEVVVTGSRIPQPGLTSVSPLTVVNSQEIKLEGTTNVEDLINNLPAAVSGQTSQIANGATGTATADLRGLGPTRTLVLVDGRRLMPGDPTLPAADLNVIPAQLVDRVEVTTGGASAIYGSDAVAGVVNFVLKHDFQGVQLDAQGGFFQTDNSGNDSVRNAINNYNQTAATKIGIPGSTVDGRKIDVTALFGANTPDDKGNVTAYVEYRNLAPVTQNNRLGSACGLGTTPSGKTNASGANIYDTHACIGSSNNPNGRFGVQSITSPTGTVLANSTAGLQALGVNTATLSNGTTPGTFVPYNNALAYNFGPLNYFQRTDDAYRGGFLAHYQVNKMFDLYSDFMFSDDRTVAQIAPSGAFAGTGANGGSTLAINCNNPLLSASQASALCGSLAGTSNLANALVGYRDINAGPRQDDLRHTEYKIDIGSRGDLGQGWNYDAYLQYGTSILSEEYQNDASVSRFQNGLLVNPATGACAGGQAGCVPINIFKANGISPAAIAYTAVPGFEEGNTTEQVASASVNGDLGQYGLKSPFASDGIGVAFGAEYRRENLVLNTDEEFSSGDLAGQGGPHLSNSGSFDVYELYGEVRVPLVQDRPFVKNLSFDGAYRFSDYSTAGITNTYEAQLQYAVNRDIAFRGGYNRAVRAPNVNELFGPKSVGLYTGVDPCAGATPTASLAQCAKTGVSTAQYGNISQCPAGQCSQLTGGNANLQPEKADTFTLGAVWTPTQSFLRGFTLTVDWFDIDVKNIIQAGFGGANSTVTQCIQTGSPTFCGLINRDPTSGIIFGQTGFVNATETNSGFLRTEGVDVEGNYHTRFTDWGLPDYGGLAFNFEGTYTYESLEQPVSGGGVFNTVGYYGPTSAGATAPIPRWRHKARLTWTTPYPLTVSVQWRFVDSLRYEGNSANPFLNAFDDTADAKLPVMQYMDLSATYRIKDGLTARFGVNNVFDNNAPVTDSSYLGLAGPPYGNGNTYPGLYDALGREFFFGITADF